MMATIIGINNISSDNKFKPGDFITFTNKEGSFAIYEGVDVSTSTFKKLTTILSYDPSKYMQTDEGYKMIPHMEVSTKLSNCEKTIDSNESNYWTRKCNEDEIKKALEIMKEYGYAWDKDNLSVVNSDTGSVIAKIHIPKIEYKGQIIKPTSFKLKQLLKMFCTQKNKKTTSYTYPGYWDYYGYDECYD
jgi:flagellar basal body rod protein FlgC